MKLIVIWTNILDVSSGKTIKLSVQQVQPEELRIISEEMGQSSLENVVHSISELYSHADTTV